LEEAARNVHPRVLALVRMGYLYEKGLGVKQDSDQAIAWYQVAAKDNDAEAKAAIKRLSSAQGR
jgi:TPR repeat protein